MAQYALKGCKLEIGAPVEVGRRSGHFWFSTLHPAGGRDVFCGATLADDKAQGEWPATLFLSRDGGASWKEALPILYGPASRVLAPGKVLMMPYELWPLKPGDMRNAKANGSIITCSRTGRVRVERTEIRFLGWPRDLASYNNDEVRMVTNGNILPRRDGTLFMATYGMFEGEDKYCVFATTSDDGGFTWRYLSTVARWQDAPGCTEGPDESNAARLDDGRLLCVYRVGSGQELWKSYSADDGATWTRPERMDGVWSVEPQLQRLTCGVMLLSSGRNGLFLWACTDGEGRDWQRLNLAEHHNASVADASMRYPDAFLHAADVNPPCSTSYTCMVEAGPDEVLISYDRLGNGWAGAPGPWGPHDAVFCVRVRGAIA
jgi:hypothetical protein